MNKIKLIINDYVKCKFVGLSPSDRRKYRKKFRYFDQNARFTPAYKNGWWDGYNYMFELDGTTYINVLDKLLPEILNDGYDVELIDNRPKRKFEFEPITKNLFSHKKWPKNHKLEGQPVVLYDYQRDAVNDFLKNINSVSVLATSAGKTLITAALAYKCEKYGNTAIIVPNKSLVKATETEFKNLGLDVGVFYGNRKELHHQHTIFTWQVLDSLDRRNRKNLLTPSEKKELEVFFETFVAVIVDETHTAKANSLKRLLSNNLSHVPIRWGMSGTLPRDDYGREIIFSLLGHVNGVLTPKELQDEGYLATCKIDILQLIDNFERKEIRGKSFQDQVASLQFREERTFLENDEQRMSWIVNFIQDIRFSKGNTLVLVNGVDFGKKLNKLIDNSDFVYGATKVDKRTEIYNSIHEKNDAVLIATYGVAAVGISMPRLFNLILVDVGKSYIRVLQSIGRGLRLAKDKKHVDIYDITSDSHFSKKQLTARKKFYKEVGYEFKVKRIKYRS